jgi:hypothetical protein
MTRRRSRVFAPEPFYTKTPECLIVLFDLRCPGAEKRLEREVDAWCGSASVEELVEGRSALIIRPGGAARLAS